MDAMQFDKAAYVELLRKLISVNKRFTGRSNPTFNLRHDWNRSVSTLPQLPHSCLTSCSLIGGNQTSPMTERTSERS